MSTTVEEVKSSKVREFKKLEGFFQEVGSLYNRYSFYVTDPPGTFDVVNPSEVSGVIEFETPVALNTLIVYNDDVVEFAKLRGLKVTKVEFTDERYRLARASLSWSDKEFGLVFRTYTGALAFLLRPELYSAIEAGKARFTNDALADFVNSLLRYSVTVMERGLHRQVDTSDIFDASWKYGWRYLLGIKNVEDVSVVGIEYSRGDYYIILVDRSFSDPIRVGIGRAKDAHYKLSKEAVARLPVVQKLIESFEPVKKDALTVVELLKVAYLGVKAYVT